MGPPAGGAGAHVAERVATFPLNYPFANKKYSYVVCEETLPGRIQQWKDFIEHAFSQWNLVTDGLVSTERVELLDENNNKMKCPDFSEYIEGEIRFNTCLTTADEYRVLVHEAGHAFGITHGPAIQYPEGKEQDRHHPTIQDAAMSYKTTLDCSPHPADIMAIYALYQTVD